MTRFVALATLTFVLAGCGATAVPGSGRMPQASFAAQGKKAKLDPKLDQAAYEAGLAVGMAKAQGKSATPKLKQGNVDKLSYDYGYAVGLLTGSIKSFDRINGSFDVYEWKAFCYMNFEAMKDARDTLKNNPDLAAKAPVVLGVLEGGIQSFSAINGSFDVSQWKSFAYSNRKVLENALNALKGAAL